jgi:hypothetical protein
MSFLGLVKVFWFNVLFMFSCAVACLLICGRYVLSSGTLDIHKEMNMVGEKISAMLCISLFVGNVKVIGKENLPSDDLNPAPVFIANHASQIDTGVVYYLDRRFKWIAKKAMVSLLTPTI